MSVGADDRVVVVVVVGVVVAVLLLGAVLLLPKQRCRTNNDLGVPQACVVLTEACNKKISKRHRMILDDQGKERWFRLLGMLTVQYATVSQEVMDLSLASGHWPVEHDGDGGSVNNVNTIFIGWRYRLLTSECDVVAFAGFLQRCTLYCGVPFWFIRDHLERSRPLIFLVGG